MEHKCSTDDSLCCRVTALPCADEECEMSHVLISSRDKEDKHPVPGVTPWQSSGAINDKFVAWQDRYEN